jgi:hypothetical protein
MNASGSRQGIGIKKKAFFGSVSGSPLKEKSDRTLIRIGIKTESLIRIRIRIVIKRRKAGPDRQNMKDPQYIINPEKFLSVLWFRI